MWGRTKDGPSGHQDVKQPLQTLEPYSYNMGEEKDLDNMRQSDSKLKVHIRFFKLVVRVLTFALSVFAIYTQVHTLQRFERTRGIQREVNGTERNAWARTTELWPTILLLVTSCLTAIVSLVTVAAYFKSVGAANRQATVIGTPMTVVEVCAHLAVWLATTIGYRIGRTGNDLWGWTCDPRARAIQDRFPEVNFNFFCRIQGGSWIASIAQVVLMIITLIVWVLAWRRHKQQKRIVRRSTTFENYQGPGRA